MPSSGASTEGEKRSVGVSATGVAMDTLRFVDGEPGLELGIGQKAPGMMRSPKFSEEGFDEGKRLLEIMFGCPPFLRRKECLSVSVGYRPA